MFISECGEDSEVCEKLISYVKINNEGLRPPGKNKREGSEGGILEVALEGGVV